MIVRSPARQGMRGSLATDGVVRRRRNTWPGGQWARWKSAVSMWLTGHGGSTLTLCLGESAEGLSGANDDNSVLVAVVGRASAWLVGVLCWRGGS
jgi:hypothetical protein